MPAAIRRRSGGASLAREFTSLGLTPLARTRTPARVAVAAPPGTPVNPAEECCICLLDLGCKRAVTLQPCSHRYHETCARTWMETREVRNDQACPLCRARTRSIIDESGTSAPPSYTFGASGEPTRVALMREEQPENLQRLLRETNTRLSRCGELESDEGKSDEYMEDIRYEKLQLERRATILTTMIEQHSRGEWAQQPTRLVRTAAELDALQEQRDRRLLLDRPPWAGSPTVGQRRAQLDERLQQLLQARRPAPPPAAGAAAATATPVVARAPATTSEDRLLPRPALPPAAATPHVVARAPSEDRLPQLPRPTPTVGQRLDQLDERLQQLLQARRPVPPPAAGAAAATATVPGPFNAGRPAAASAGRAAAVAASSSSNGAAAVAAARRTTEARAQQLLRAAAARRDAAQATAGARAPHPDGRVAVQMATAAGVAPNYTEAPRRSARIAAMKGSGAGARLPL